MNRDCSNAESDNCAAPSPGADFDCASSVSMRDRQELHSHLTWQNLEETTLLTSSGVLPCFELSDDCAGSGSAAGSSWESFEGSTLVTGSGSLAPSDCSSVSDSTAVPLDTAPMTGGMDRVELGDGAIPAALESYASYDGDTLVIDARGNEIPPLSITRDNVVIRNARIEGSDGPTVGIYGANNVSIENSEISGGQRGVLADHSNNVTVQGNWLHDFRWNQWADTSAVEFDYVSGGLIEGNKVTGLYKSDAISMFNSQNLRTTGNNVDVTIDEPSASPMMVEGSASSGIEVSNNVIKYQGDNSVPPGILGGTNNRAFDNLVNGDRSSAAWQLYAYDSVWSQIYFDGQRVSGS